MDLPIRYFLVFFSQEGNVIRLTNKKASQTREAFFINCDTIFSLT